MADHSDATIRRSPLAHPNSLRDDFWNSRIEYSRVFQASGCTEHSQSYSSPFWFRAQYPPAYSGQGYDSAYRSGDGALVPRALFSAECRHPSLAIASCVDSTRVAQERRAKVVLNVLVALANLRQRPAVLALCAIGKDFEREDMQQVEICGNSGPAQPDLGGDRRNLYFASRLQPPSIRCGNHDRGSIRLLDLGIVTQHQSPARGLNPYHLIGRQRDSAGREHEMAPGSERNLAALYGNVGRTTLCTAGHLVGWLCKGAGNWIAFRLTGTRSNRDAV